jgi:CRISPR/Cas system-associated protein Cas7 (RAMP superfamily)
MFESLGSFSTTDQGTDRGTGVLRFSEMDTSLGADKETSKALYQKGNQIDNG